MNTALATKTDDALEMWSDNKSLGEIKEIFCPLLTDSEFKAFIGLGRATGLNPFLREIDAIKYDKTKAAQFVIRRDGYRKSAQRNPDYEFHRVAAIYSNDVFENDNGVINHKYKFSDRGHLLGAYCMVKKRSASQPIYVDVLLSEYDKKQSCWGNMKETMIKKTAESQCFRAAFQEIFAGSVSEEEFEMQSHDANNYPRKTKSDALMNKLNIAKGRVVEAEPVENNEETGELASKEELEEIHALLAVKNIGDGYLQKALSHYDVESLGQLTASQAKDFISRLNKLEEKCQ